MNCDNKYMHYPRTNLVKRKVEGIVYAKEGGVIWASKLYALVAE
ncbi:MAG: hypothetical protein OHK0057_15580 [Thermoflexibacter sp.]